MGQGPEVYKLKGRQIMFLPNFNQSKMASMNSAVEHVTTVAKEKQAEEIKALNARKAAAARRAKAKAAKEGGK